MPDPDRERALDGFEEAIIDAVETGFDEGLDTGEMRAVMLSVVDRVPRMEGDDA